MQSVRAALRYEKEKKPGRQRQSLLCFVVLWASVFLWVLSPLSAREVFGISLDTFPITDDWHSLSLHSKRRIAPYLLDEIQISQNAKRARIFLKALKEEGDPILLAYYKISSIYFRRQKKADILKGLWSLQQLAKDRQARLVVSYYIGRQSNKRNRRLAICQLRSHERICQWEYFTRELDLLHQKTRLNKQQIQRLIRYAKPFLIYKNSWVPLSLRELSNVGTALYQIGLPLEAALLIERFTWRHPSREQALRLRQQIPYFLAGAGDFPSALRFSFGVTTNPDLLVRNARLDWMILGGDYKRALDYIQKLGTSGLVPKKQVRFREAFSHFPHSKDGLRLKSAMLLYLSGDVASSARALKRLTAIRGEIGGAPARHFARLRLVQILLKKEPDLAHKMAEDMTYLAQEKSWYVLEYYATILDGWAQYFRGKYYKALINFIKAQGILKGSERRFYLTYSHTLGLFAARQKLAPHKNYNPLIQAIQSYLSQTPKNEALFVLRDWVPKGFGPDFFRELAWEHYNRRKRHADAVLFLLAQRTWERSFFATGKNPGGAKGFASSARWIRLLADFTGKRIRPELELQAKAFELLQRERQNISENLPKLQHLSPRQAYAFSFSVGSRQVYYLLAPGTQKIKKRRRVRIIRKLLWSQSTLSKQAHKAATNSCAKYSKNCKTPYLQKLRTHLQKSRIKRLNLLYAPEDRLDLRQLLLTNLGTPGTNAKFVPVYFSRLRLLPPDTVFFQTQIFSSTACNWIGVPIQKSRNLHFRRTYLQYRRPPRAIQIWPKQLDSTKNRNGHPRPVYLRHFQCGGQRLRLWDMERFSHPDGPGLVVLPAWRGEEKLNLAISEFLAKRKTSLLIVQESAQKLTRKWLSELQRSPKTPILQSYKALYVRAPNSILVLPGLLP